MELEEIAEYAMAVEEPAQSVTRMPDQPSASTRLAVLTRRETEVAVLVAQGLTNRGIAARLMISEQTAATHVKRILRKLRLNTRSQLAVWVTEQRLRSSTLR